MTYRDRCYQSYTTTRFGKTHALTPAEFDFHARVARKRYRHILPADRSARILDVACGTGHFLYFLQGAGYTDASGIDLSAEQVAVAAKMGVQNVRQGDCFPYLSEHIGAFDMIVINDLLEHLSKDEVVDLLDAVHGSLVDGGRVLIGVPNALTFFGSGMVHTDYTHIQGFTPKGLQQVLTVCRFTDISVYGEKPVVLDLRSALRAGLWRCLSAIGKAILTIENGTGRGFRPGETVLEPRIFAEGKKDGR